VKTEVLNLWPIPLYKSFIDVKEEWISIVEKSDFQRNTINNADMSKNYYILDKIPDLKKLIIFNINNFTKNYLKIEDNFTFYILNSWINKHNLNDWSQSHFHGNSLISGVYYIKTPPESGDIEFIKNNLHINLFGDNLVFHYKEDTFLNAESIKVIPKQGLILLFPSHLHHKVGLNKIDKSRYSIAFNVFVKGKFGNGEIMDLEI
jgi:uncharacterized protein (TIGR02466 family)